MSEIILQGAKGGGDEAHTPVESPNTLLSVSYAKVLLAVGEGQLAGNPTGKDIYLNGTPLLNADGAPNFGGVTWEWRDGSQDQTYIQGMPETSNEVTVGVELTQLNPWTQSLTKKSLSAARVTLNWPALQEQKANGDTVGYEIKYALEVSVDGGPYELYEEHAVTGKTNSEYERTHTIRLPRNPRSGWTIRVRRLTGNSQSALIQDTMKVKSYTEVVDMKSTYPNTALLFVQFDSRLFGGGQIPTISVETRGRVIRVPDNYDPELRIYTGIWSGAFKWAWTDNPAWVYYDILTQERFGLGSRVRLDQVDKWSLYELAQYCDVPLDDGTGAGTKSPRHTCNIFIQNQSDAWTVLRDLATIFNGMTYWNGTQFTVLADKQEDLSSLPLFSRSNVINGKFNYQTTDERSLFTSALISYDDPKNHYGTEVEAVWEKSEILRWGGDRQTTISAIGCTSRAEAQRRGKYQLLTNLYNRSTTFRTGLQGLAAKCQPGKIIAVADPVVGGKPFTGRLVGGAPTVVTLDRDVEAVPGDVLFITNSKGVQQGRTIQSVHGRVIQVTVKYDEVPQGSAIWYLESSTLKSQLFRVTKVSQPENGIYEITGVEYNDSKYAAIDEGARLEARPVSVTPSRIQAAPRPVTISAQSYVEQTMALTTMTISWPQTEFAVSYEVQWRVGLGDWVPLGSVGANSIDVKGVYAGQYVARVRATNAMGTKSVWASSQTTTIVGKQGAPNALASLTTTSEIFGIGLKWRFKPGSEDTAFTDIQEADSVDGLNARTLSTVSYPTDDYLKSGLAAGVQFFYRARLIDRTGNIGPYTEWVRGASSSNADEILDYIKGQIDESSISKELNDRIDKIEVTEVEVGKLGVEVGKINTEVDKINVEVVDIKKDVEGLHKDVTQLGKDIDRVDGSVNWLESQVSGLENQLQNDITVVNKNLSDAIEQTNNDIEELKDDVDDLNEVVVKLQDQVAGYVDALEYDYNKAYFKGESVRLNQKLYQAIIDVPIGVAPPNPTYWKDVGDIVTDLGALSAQVSTNTATITRQGNSIVAQGQQLNALDTRLGTTDTKVNANASAIQNLQTNVTQQGQDISTNTQAITALSGAVNNLETGQAGNASAIESLRTTVTLQGDTLTSQGQQLTSIGAEVKALQTDVSGVKSEVQAQGTAISGLTTTVTQQGDTIKSHTNSITSLEGSVTKITTDLDGLTVKVDATSTAVTNLSNTVTQQGNTITSQGRDITTLKADVVSVTTDVNGLKTTVTAQGQAISNLETKVTKNGEDITALSTSITNLTAELHLNAIDDLYDKAETDQQIGDALNIAEGAASATQTLSAEVTKQGDKVEANAQRLTNLEASLTDINGNVVGVGSAIESLRTQVTQQGNTITSQGQAITTLNNSLTLVDTKADKAQTSADKAQGDATNALTQITTKADASAVDSLTTRVTNAEGKITSQGESITKLDNSLTITNQNVTAAQQAAQAASDKAGAKGEVIYGTAQPAADKRLPQNLWIDTTNNANTPKRWNGTAWVAVTDKVAVDAAAAAANALSVANTKADASALTALTTRVETSEGKITSQGESIVSLNNNLTITNNNVTEAQKKADEAFTLAQTKADSSAVQSLTNTVTQQGTTITAQGQAITNLTASLKTTDDKVNLKADASTVTALTNTVTKQGEDISANTSALTSLKTEVQFKELDELYQGAETEQQIAEAFNIANGAASATQQLTSSVTNLEGVITAQGQEIVELKASLAGIDVNAVGEAVQSLQVVVTSQGNTISSQGQSITTLTNNLALTDQKASDALTKVETKADASAVTALTNRVTSVEGVVTSQGQSITQLNNSITRVEGKADKAQTDATNALQQITTKADASALTSLTTRVTDAEGKITSQGQSITQLDNSLVTTNNNVTAAQKAAQDASDKAGLKGEVIYGSTAPTADKRLPQNLWIDTASGANTPKRWNGTAWVSVTDKVATDAANAAQNALTQVSTKADASALQALSTTVTKQGDTITSLGQDVVTLNNSLTVVSGKVDKAQTDATSALTKVETKADSSAVTALTSRVSDAEGKITSQGQSLTELNNSITSVNTKVDKAQADATSALTQVATKADASAVTSLTNRVTSVEGKVTSQGESITSLNNSLTITNQNVTAAQKAAQDANTLAGGKGEVIYGSTAPTVAQRLPQNLWIDTTANANTPKRWNGNAWVAVTDKVATDAAAAANDALSKVALKADASAVTQLSTKVEAIDGKVTTQANALTQLTTRVTNTETGVTGNATAISQTNTKVSEIDGKLTTVSTRVDGVYAQLNPRMAGSTESLAGDTSYLVGVWSEQSARIEGDVATGQRIDNVQATVGENNALIRETSKAVVDLDGKVSTTWSVRLEVNANGQYKWAGVGLGLENGPGGLQSTFIVDADKFAIGQGDTIPFAVVNGQVFLKETFITKATITNGLIGETLKSTANTTWGGPVMEVNFNTGSMITRNPSTPNTTTTLNQNGVDVIVAGVRRVRMGVW